MFSQSAIIQLLGYSFLEDTLLLSLKFLKMIDQEATHGNRRQITYMFTNNKPIKKPLHAQYVNVVEYALRTNGASRCDNVSSGHMRRIKTDQAYTFGLSGV